MTTTRTGPQPGHPPARPQSMGPLDIARSRLHDLAQGALPDLFDQESALRIAARLDYLERHHEGLRRAVGLLLATLQDTEHPTQITGSTTAVVHLARAIDLTAEELNQP